MCSSDLQHTHADLRNPSITKSLSDIDQIDFEPSHSLQNSGEHPGSRETTPPDLHFIHNFGFSHPRSAQQSLTGPSTSVIHTSTVQTNPFHQPPPILHPPPVNPPFFPQPPAMATWYAPLVLLLPLFNLPQDYQSKIPLYDANGSTTTSQHVDKMNDYFDRNGIDDETVKLGLFA